ncbi:unnamed protein product [Rotaria sp. Silwood2]|nr:unnamed protein product [Rotaria sp. Silwood2]
MHHLKVLPTKYKAELGIKSTTLIANILQGDITDLQLVQLALETLTNIMTYDVDSDEEQSDLLENSTIQFTKLYIKNKEHVHAILELILKTDFNVRHAAIQFLTALVTNCTEELQRIILDTGPEGFSKVFDLLEDKHEVIQHDAVVLLQHLIGSNPDVQVLIVIKYGFQYILDIIVSKQSVDEDLTVEDCLSLLLTLFQNNSKNQLYFCQSFCVRYLFDAFELSLTRETRWSTQKVTNVHLLLQIIRTVVSPKNSIKNIRTCQHLLKQYGKDRKTITRGNI